MKSKDIEIKELLDAFHLNGSNLSGSQFNFVDGCRKQFARNKELSEGQMKILREIHRYMKPEVRFVNNNMHNEEKTH
jgi:hypothetical protein